VHFAELTENEFAEYKRLSLRIANLMSESTLQEEKTSRGDSNQLTILLNRRARIVKLAEEKLFWLTDLLSQSRINKCLIYCADLEQVDAVQGLLRDHGISHLPYTSKQPSYAQQAALEQLRRNDIQAVVAVKCLDEGIDVPQVHQAILLASSTSEREFVQRRGRILRRAEGKSYAHLIDVFTVPPRRYHDELPTLLFNELRRAKILARAAENRLEAELKLDEELSRFGIPIEQIIGA
jgi:superfamily II DNA or RNA helicase